MTKLPLIVEETPLRVLITGIDGYLGWPLAINLQGHGHTVAGVDSLVRRETVNEMGSISAIPIKSIEERLEAFQDLTGSALQFFQGDLVDYDIAAQAIIDFKPDAIVHLAECPSAPYSMIDVRKATWVQTNNVIGTLNLLFAMRDHSPAAHLLKLGTMGEYGTPNLDIPEGFFEIEYRGRKDRLPFPRQAGSWYHQSKVHDSNNVMLACKLWGLSSTDVMQGVVFGTRSDDEWPDDRFSTRLDFDEAFGTVINRFCVQAVIGHPLTPFGKGTQKRGFLPLRDSIQCMRIAIENPPEKGEYRVLNQFENVYSVNNLAEAVQRVGDRLGIRIAIEPIENPRVESEDHHYNPDHQRLFDMGYEPISNIEAEIELMLRDLLPHRDELSKYWKAVLPGIVWNPVNPAPVER